MRSYPPSPDVLSAVLNKLVDRPDITLDDPVVDIADAQILGIIDIANKHLPGIFCVCLFFARHLRIQLLN